MFCQNCGNQVPDNAKFCMNCGASIAFTVNDQTTQFVAAKCTNCGGAINVNPHLKSGICPYCNYEFIVSQAIQNNYYNINGNMNIANANINMGPSAENLAKRGLEAEKAGDNALAIEYYNRSLDIDIDCVLAKEGLERIKLAGAVIYYNKARTTLESDAKKALEICKQGLSEFPDYQKLLDLKEEIEEYIKAKSYYKSEVFSIWGKKIGVLELKNGELVYYDKMNNATYYSCESIIQPMAFESMKYKGETFGRTEPNCIKFIYDGVEEVYNVHKAKDLAALLREYSKK